jgi:hypothetical protein
MVVGSSRTRLNDAIRFGLARFHDGDGHDQ